jgi:hypothetical protein
MVGRGGVALYNTNGIQIYNILAFMGAKIGK